MDEQELLQAVERYQYAIHTQEASDFLPLWAQGCETVMISPTGYFTGTQNIYESFLLGRIRQVYERIDLISHNIDVRVISSDLATVVFSYSTDCIRRDTGEPYGIAGLETQVYCRQNAQWKLVHVHYSVQKER